MWKIAEDMLKDAELRGAIDIIGTHCPGPLNGRSAVPPGVAEMGKPLWAGLGNLSTGESFKGFFK